MEIDLQHRSITDAMRTIRLPCTTQEHIIQQHYHNAIVNSQHTWCLAICMKVVDDAGEKTVYTTEYITSISLGNRLPQTSKHVEFGCCPLFVDDDFTCRSCWSSVIVTCFSVEGPPGLDMSAELIGDND